MLMKTSKKPIVLTMSSVSPADRPIVCAKCKVFQFNRPPANALLRHARLLCLAEGLNSVCTADLARLIAVKERDVRATICALQNWASGPDNALSLGLTDVLGGPPRRLVEATQTRARLGRRGRRAVVDAATRQRGGVVVDVGEVDEEEEEHVSAEEQARSVVETDALATMLDVLSSTDFPNPCDAWCEASMLAPWRDGSPDHSLALEVCLSQSLRKKSPVVDINVRFSSSVMV